MKLFLIISLSALAFGHTYAMETEPLEIFNDTPLYDGETEPSIEVRLARVRAKITEIEQEINHAKINGDQPSIDGYHIQLQETLDVLTFLQRLRFNRTNLIQEKLVASHVRVSL